VKFVQTPIAGAFMLDAVRHEDDRGFFARVWCEREATENNININFVQCSVSFNKHTATLRGLHYQVAPHQEAKLVRCTQGSVYDVILDLRPDSPTYRHHFGAELSAQSRQSLYVPKGLAQGFITLEPNTEVYYQISEYHAPEYARGVRWNDPSFAIHWPIMPRVISERDRTCPDYEMK
jgi:dTDP-4-dehydrorhamnose 3,5-epimerase